MGTYSALESFFVRLLLLFLATGPSWIGGVVFSTQIGVAISFQLILQTHGVNSCGLRHSNMPISTTFSVPSPTSVAATSSESDVFSDNSNKTISNPTESNTNIMLLDDPRSCILRVGADAGRLCGIGNQYLLEEEPSMLLEELTEVLSDLFISLCSASKSLDLNWIQSIRSKMALNAKKYPVEHCKGKAGKYTKYSHLTGITTTNQSTMEFREDSGSNTNQSVISLEDFAEHHLQVLADDIREFAEDRLWTKYHKPRNLILALMGEVGELSEILQYEGDDDAEISLLDRLKRDEQEKIDKLSQELADVSIYAIRLATVCNAVGRLRDSLLSQKIDVEAKQLFD